MPARTALAPGRIPRRLSFLGALPQHEVERIVFRHVDLHPLARTQIIQRFPGQFTVAFELAHRVVHVAIACLVGQALLAQHLNHVEHALHVLRGARLVIGLFDT